MATLYTYGGTPADVLTDTTGTVVPDYPINVRVADTGQLVTELYEADGMTPIAQLRSNPATSTAPGSIRTFMTPWTQIEYEYNATGGRTVTWYESGREVATEALQAAQTAATNASTAADQAATALTTANNAASQAATAAAAASQAETDATTAIQAVTTALPATATVDSLPATVYDAHRGGAGESPENTLAAMHAAMPWVDVLDLDSQMIGDGTPVIRHDTTVDRTTKGTGNVSTWNAAQWRLLRADPSSYFAANAPDLPVPTVEQVLDELGGKRVMTVEAKTATDVTPLADLIKARRLERSVLINTSNLSLIPEIKDAGCLAHLWRSATQMQTDDPAAIKATGADLLDLDIAGTDAQIQAAVAQSYPLGVWAHTLTRRSQRDRALGLGCRGIITDYPAYVSGKAVRRTASTFSTGFWGPGYVATGTTRPVLDSSGRIPIPAPTSSTDTQVLLAGEVSPAPAATTIDMKFSFPTAGSSGWGLVHLHVGASDDPTALTSTAILHDGYTAQVTATSALRLYRDEKTAGTSTQLVNTSAGATLAANTVYTLRLAITATQITVSVPEVSGLTATVTESTFRVPWYVFVGRNYSATSTGLIWINSITTT